MTMIPNEVIDVYLRELKPGELKVLLVVLRQTLGYRLHPNSKQRKQRDWIAISQMQMKTGCDRKTIAKAIAHLQEMRVIEISDQKGKQLETAEARKKAHRLYFSQCIRTGDNEGIS